VVGHDAIGLVVLLLTTSVFAQSAPPKQAKPQAPVGCKLVGTVKGTKLWAGDCAGAAGLWGSDTTSPSLPEPQFHPVKSNSLSSASWDRGSERSQHRTVGAGDRGASWDRFSRLAAMIH
jgi:hypothetical protein